MRRQLLLVTFLAPFESIKNIEEMGGLVVILSSVDEHAHGGLPTLDTLLPCGAQIGCRSNMHTPDHTPDRIEYSIIP